ncbi:Uncharacterised protein [BD1-7 clade bacterium]|uniref:IraD/Gp25-like domain-containing protein n=1 Tax=BD1-7 clade bacterium TaxID=2029982 RepID=A0A5S9Q2F1_9GAMM|nr:Uncharacterised protein [BD1-7 clade bacterium]CAA0111762.1 Uncharacterised protein [BD1-7 clade bacterium]
MNVNTGQAITGSDHLRQSIQDILTTPIGTRVMRRDYGSDLFELLDAPANEQTIIDVYAATADAIAKQEPRYQLARVQAYQSEQSGRYVLDLEGIDLTTGQALPLEGIQL